MLATVARPSPLLKALIRRAKFCVPKELVGPLVQRRRQRWRRRGVVVDAVRVGSAVISLLKDRLHIKRQPDRRAERSLRSGSWRTKS